MLLDELPLADSTVARVSSDASNDPARWFERRVRLPQGAVRQSQPVRRTQLLHHAPEPQPSGGARSSDSTVQLAPAVSLPETTTRLAKRL